MKFKNPIIPGFHPDPSICRVGEDYYIVTSSFEYFPGVPLYHSKDLANWREISHCLTRKSQLNLEKAKTSGGIYAPTIRYHNGVLYMVTTNISAGGNFYVFTENPSGEWSEPIRVEQGGIDPSIFFDSDGKVYFTSTGNDCIVQSEIDIATGQRLTDIRELWKGTGGSCPEGPHLYKIGGYYYLMIAEGGTEYGHMETIARSKSPWGPFESCPRNPILTHRSTTSPIQATGHADLIEAPNGTWWLVFLGIRPNGHPYCHHLGRETFLAPVKWSSDGWPVVGIDGKAALEMEGDLAYSDFRKEEKARDDFEDKNLAVQWNFLRNPYDEDRSLTERPGWLKLLGSRITLNDLDSPAFLGRRQEHFCCEVAALLDFTPHKRNEEAGLTIRMNERHHYEIAVAVFRNKRRVFVRRRIGGLESIVARENIGDGPITLRIIADRDTYRFSYSLDDKERKPIAEGETRYLSTEVAGGWTGVFFGMYATGNGKRSIAPAYFDWFDYVPKDGKA